MPTPVADDLRETVERQMEQNASAMAAAFRDTQAISSRPEDTDTAAPDTPLASPKSPSLGMFEDSGAEAGGEEAAEDVPVRILPCGTPVWECTPVWERIKNPVGLSVWAWWYEAWHPATVRAIPCDGVMQVLWSEEHSMSDVPDTHVVSRMLDPPPCRSGGTFKARGHRQGLCAEQILEGPADASSISP